MSKNRMFPLMLGEHNNHLANMGYEEKRWLWHLMYRHLNFHSLNLPTSKELVFIWLRFKNTSRFVKDVLKENMQEINFQKKMLGGPIIHFS